VPWQYPPGAALVILAPGLLPWSYLTSFMVLVGVFDALAIVLLVRTGIRRRRRQAGAQYAGAWMWVVGVPLLGPTVYARYDLIVTAVAIVGLLSIARHPRLGGALLGVGGLLKLWPLMAVIGTPRGRRTRRTWTAAAATAAGIGFLVAAAMNGAFQFLTFQKDRGVEIESLASLPIHWARMTGRWQGQVTLNYGSVEFLGPWVHTIARVSMVTTLLAFGWLLVWRLRARNWQPATPYDAALSALLVFTVTSRVISPQYLVWLVGLAAVCLTVRGTTQRSVALLILLATAMTLVEFPVMFGQVAGSSRTGVAVLTARNLLLLSAAVISCGRLWRSTAGTPSDEPADTGRYEGEWADDEHADQDYWPGDDAAAPTRVGSPFEAETLAYSVRPGIAYEQDLLDDLEPDPGPPLHRPRTSAVPNWANTWTPDKTSP
jgi:hypothetical protein